MNITQIRNATQVITYAGKRFLVDPMLSPFDRPFARNLALAHLNGAERFRE